MKNRSSLVLMEQLVMVLVFALAATMCLRLFVFAGQTARRTQLREEAVILAQNTAEELKASRGQTPGSFENEALAVTVIPEDTGVPGLGGARVEVAVEKEIFAALSVRWQEVAP